MQYYNSKGELLDFTLSKSFNHGTTANIYKLEDSICFKIYYTFINYFGMNSDIFNIIKEINHESTYKLLDTYYDKEKINNPNSLKRNLNNYKIDAYSYYYLEESNIEIFDIDCEYLIESINKLEEFISILSELKVEMFDIRRENAIFTSNGIVLIDLDGCKIDKTANSSTNLTATWNKKRLIHLLIDLFIKSEKYDISYSTNCREKEKIYELFSFDLEKSIKESVSKKLIKCKNVDEYLRNS